MKSRLLMAVLTLAVLCPAGATWAQDKSAQPSNGPAAEDWKKVPIPALPAFKPQQPTRIQLKNGMVIFLQVNHELPLITGYARIRGGSRTEPKDKTGLIDIYGDAWRTSGTAKMNGDQMDDYLEARAAKIETDGGVDSTTISFDCLKQDFTDVFALFQDLLRNPDFKADKIDLSKDQMRTSIARRNDSSQGIAGRESGYLAYGKDNPYVRSAQYWTVAAVTKEDLAAWHKAHVIPNNILLGIEGDFDPKEMEASLRAAFDKWPKGTATPEPAITMTPAKPGVYVADKPEVNQSEVRLVELGIDRKNPDYFAISVFNELFGGGFSSRLFSNLRTKQGLAYAVGGGIGSSFDHVGVTRLTIGTKTPTTADAIKGMLEQIDELKSNPPTDVELKRAKDSVLNSFVFNFDTPGKVLREQMTYEYYGYPKDFLERYRAEVDKVTLADVNRVAQKYLKKDQLAILVVGNIAEIEKSLAAFGPVTKLDITIPTEPAGSKAAAQEKPAASNDEGKKLMAKVVEGMGGAEKINAVKGIHQVIATSQKIGPAEVPLTVDSTTIYPATQVQKISTPMGEMLRVTSPDTGFMTMQGQTRDLPASFKSETVAQIHRGELSVAQHASDPAYTFAAGGTEKVGDKDTQVLEVAFEGQKVKWNVDPQTGHVVRSSYQATGATGPVQREITNTEWKTVDGITLATKYTINENGAAVGGAEVKSFDLNPTIDPKTFQKPQ